MRVDSALNRYQSFNANRTIAERLNKSAGGIRASQRKGMASTVTAGQMKKIPSDLQSILSREEKYMLNKLFPHNTTLGSVSTIKHFAHFGNQIDLKI